MLYCSRHAPLGSKSPCSSLDQQGGFGQTAGLSGRVWDTGEDAKPPARPAATSSPTYGTAFAAAAHDRGATPGAALGGRGSASQVTRGTGANPRAASAWEPDSQGLGSRRLSSVSHHGIRRTEIGKYQIPWVRERCAVLKRRRTPSPVAGPSDSRPLPQLRSECPGPHQVPSTVRPGMEPTFTLPDSTPHRQGLPRARV